VARDLAHDGTLSYRPQPESWAQSGSPLRRELLTQSFVSTLPSILRYADRSSMAHSREVRLPFLDRRVAEFGYSLPTAHLYRQGMTKRILRDATRGVVPAEILARRDKVGFEPPQALWLTTPDSRELICNALLDPAARSRGLYEPTAIEADARAGRWRDSDAIWRALNTELWLRALVGPASQDAPPARVHSSSVHAGGR
jgi:asparagine synthase (glutamine-hydrolysing)